MFNYIVEVGDSLASIARKFGVSVGELVSENNLENVFYLEPGLELIIPEAVNGESIEEKESLLDYYMVKPGDNLYAIGLKYGIDDKVLAQINGLELNEYIYPDQQLLVPKENVVVYITKEEETLESVSNLLNAKEEDIIRYNDIYLLPEQMIVYRAE